MPAAGPCPGLVKSLSLPRASGGPDSDRRLHTVEMGPSGQTSWRVPEALTPRRRQGIREASLKSPSWAWRTRPTWLYPVTRSLPPWGLGSAPAGPPGTGTTHPGLLENGLGLGLLGRDHGAFGARITSSSEPELQELRRGVTWVHSCSTHAGPGAQEVATGLSGDLEARRLRNGIF